jgi:hypothetical protein
MSASVLIEAVEAPTCDTLVRSRVDKGVAGRGKTVRPGDAFTVNGNIPPGVAALQRLAR